MAEDTDIAQEQATEQMLNAAEDIKNKAKLAGAAAWDATRATYKQVQNKAVDYSRATDSAIRENPYMALGFSFCLGMLIGALATRPKVIQKEND